jgi:hypothetical protein
MVTRPTGNRPGRPRVPLREHPLRFGLALAEAIRRGLKVSGNKARALAIAELRTVKISEEPSTRLAPLYAKIGGEIVSYDIERLPGDPDEEDPSKRVQEINTLEKMMRRGIAEDERDYFDKLSTCFFAAIFSKTALERRAAGIELLSREIGEEAHFAGIVAKLREMTAEVAHIQ